MNLQRRPPLLRRLGATVLCSLFFMLCYNLTNHLAASADHHYQAHWDWELAIPLLPWLIVPYWSINLFFVVAFLCCANHTELRILTYRVLVAIAVAALCFVLWPMTLAHDREAILDQAGLFHPLFTALYSFDLPHNLFPSLHVTFAVLFSWHLSCHLSCHLAPAQPRSWPRWVIHGWFGLIILSTLLVHQHHLIDVLGGIILGLLCCYGIRDRGSLGHPISPGALRRHAAQ